MTVQAVKEEDRIHIVGGGPVGALAALVLAKRGVPVTLYEHRRDYHPADGDRTINLSLTSRGLKALEEVGLRKAAEELSIPKRKRIVHDYDGKIAEIPYGRPNNNEVLHSISRNELNMLLIGEATANPLINVHFDRHCTDYDPDTSTLTYIDERNVPQQIKAHVVIGADGASGKSMMREALSKRSDFKSSLEVLDYGYKELEIPQDKAGEIENMEKMARDAIHMWPRGKHMLVAMPKKGKEGKEQGFRVSIFLPTKGPDSFETLTTPQAAEAFFKREYPTAYPRMTDLLKDFLKPADPSRPEIPRRPGRMVTVRCDTWHVKGRTGKALLIGDAAHAVVPFHAQGMNAGFEDCSKLGELLDKHLGQHKGHDWETIFSELEVDRKPNTDALAEVSLAHRHKLLNTSASPEAVFRQQLAFTLEHRTGGKFIGFYSMVAHHPEIPYVEALRRGRIADEILDELCQPGVLNLEQVNWTRARELIDGRLGGAGDVWRGFKAAGSYTSAAEKIIERRKGSVNQV